MAKIIMHIDLNAFFANAELLRHKEYIGKPIAVGGSSRRGVISTASYEARAYGVKSAMPLYLAKRLCPDLIVIPGDHQYYLELSNKFFSYIKKHCSEVIEVASIDECFVDMTLAMKNVKDPYKYLKDLQLDLKKETGLSCSIGLGPTKFLAKMGSDYKKPMGITIIRKRDIKKILYPLPIGDMYGVGKKTIVKLQKLGIYKIGDFAIREDDELKKLLGKMYFVLKDWINGLGDNTVSDMESDPKSISTSSTFMYDTASYDELTTMLKRQSISVGKELNKKNMIGLTIHLTLRDSEFKTITRSHTIEQPIKDADDVYLQVMKLFDKYWNGNEIRLIGVGVSSLHNKENFVSQLNLFTIEKDIEECKTRLLINELNRKQDKELFMTLKDYKKKKEEEK